MKRLVLLACVLSAGVAAPADAQRYQPRELNVGGAYPACGSVPTTVGRIPDIALSTPGMIHLNPALFRLPRPLQLFWYAHECAHQLYGTSEDHADCWAIRSGRDEGWFRQEDFALLPGTLRAEGDARHLPARQRIDLLWRCFANGADQYPGPPAQGPGLASYAQVPAQVTYPPARTAVSSPAMSIPVREPVAAVPALRPQRTCVTRRRYFRR